MSTLISSAVLSGAVEYFELPYKFDCPSMKLSKPSLKKSQSWHGVRLIRRKICITKKWKTFVGLILFFFHVQWDVETVYRTTFIFWAGFFTVEVENSSLLPTLESNLFRCCIISAGARSWLVVKLSRPCRVLQYYLRRQNLNQLGFGLQQAW